LFIADDVLDVGNNILLHTDRGVMDEYAGQVRIIARSLPVSCRRVRNSYA
jgi:hypothetical protein